ncbi:hypothetical protein AB0I34_39970 [Kribbella sp. NPDC050281]|uniref:hypothetical protein n=1 Tax=Kribbella sp. NPDC050281 TaxID=3155515 RepID=UPI0033CC18DB
MTQTPDPRPATTWNMTMRISTDMIESLLQSQGLSSEQISTQSVEQLQESLQKVNQLIDASRSSERSAGLTFWVIQGHQKDPSSLAISQKLLDQKSLILTRLQQLQPAEKIREIREAITARVPDSTARASLLKVVDDAVSDQKKEQERLTHEKQEVESEERRQKLQMEMMERRTAIYHTFLERESIASIVGAVLLLLLAGSLIVAMFVGTAVTEVVSNSFLLVLGYFFGQGVARIGRGKSTAD